MRNFIDIVTRPLLESTTFYPSVVSVEDWDGKPTTVTREPEGMSREVVVPCEYCEGTGQDWEYDHSVARDANGDLPKIFHANGMCFACDGAKTQKKWQYDFPRFRVSYMMVELLCQIIGQEFDHSGHIDFEHLPALKRRLIGILNKNDVTDFTRPATEEGGDTIVDKSGEVPRITKTAKVYGGGINDEQLRDGVKEMLNIVDWAQKHNCGVTWA